MKKHVFLITTALFSFSYLPFSFAMINENIVDSESSQKTISAKPAILSSLDLEWLPRRLHPQVRQIEELILSESLTATIYDDTKKVQDFGFSFPRIPAIQWSLLKAVSDQYSKNNETRPLVLDGGAGHGFATRHIILAGGKVVPVEKQVETAKKLQENILKVKPFLKEGETVVSVCPKIYPKDILDFENTFYNQTYFATWSGNLLHFFAPQQVSSYVNQLFKVTEPGGYAFAQANTPFHKSKDIYKLYQQQTTNNNAFPGYMVIDRMRPASFFKQNGNTYAKPNGMEMQYVKAYTAKDGDPLPWEERPGRRDAPEKELRYNQESQGFFTFSGFHGFDRKTLTHVFTEAGFDVISCYYMLSTDPTKKIERDLSQADLDYKTVYSIGIEAQKPLQTRN